MLPPGLRVAILGSSSFHHPENRLTCQELGRALAEIPDFVLLTGGVRGVGETVGRAFHQVFEVLGAPAHVFHVLPKGPHQWDYGPTLYIGTTMEHRREVLGRLAGCYIVIEGGPGTEHESEVALSRGALVIPVGRSGGHAAVLHARGPRPATIVESTWVALGSTEASPTKIVDAVMKAVGTWASRRAGR